MILAVRTTQMRKTSASMFSFKKRTKDDNGSCVEVLRDETQDVVYNSTIIISLFHFAILLQFCLLLTVSRFFITVEKENFD